MKKWLCILALSLMASPAFGFEINAGISGSWFNDNKPGHGFAVEYTETEGACEQIDGQGCLVVYWFAYDKEEHPIFLLGVLPVDGNLAEGEMLYFSGQEFGSFTPPPTQMSWGSLRLRFTGCNAGFANYESGFPPPDGGDSFDEEGSFKITRLAFVSDLDCGKAARVADMPGTEAAGFYIGSASSRGFDDDEFIESRPVAAIIRENGEAYLLWPGLSIFRGQLTGEGLALSGNLKAMAGFPGELANGNTTGNVQVDFASAATLNVLSTEPRPGTGRPADFLEGHWSGQGIEGDFRLGHERDSNRPADMDRVSGCWLLTINGSLSVLPTSIAANGDFSFELTTHQGQDCAVSGSFEPAGEGWNVFDAQAQLSDCDFAGDYDGTMLIGENSQGAPGNDSLLVFLMDNGERAFVGEGAGLNPSQCE